MLALAVHGISGLSQKGECGHFTPSKQADIALIRCDRPSLRPVHDAVTTLVLQANAGDVDSVLVAGRPVKRAGQLVDVDLPALLSNLDDSRDHLEGATHGLDHRRILELAAPLFPLEQI